MAKHIGLGSALILTALASTACGNHDDADQPISWIGHTYMLSLAKGDFAVPAHVGDDLFGVAPTFFFKIDGSGKDLTATLATGPGTTTDTEMTMHPRTPEDAVLDTCGPTTTIPFSGADYPHSTFGVDDVRLFFLNPTTPPLQVTADVYGLKFTDVLPNGGTPSKTGTLDATMDFQQIVVLLGLLGPGRTAAQACQTFHDHYTRTGCTDASCMVGCTACPTASASETCLSIEAQDVGAVEAPSIMVTDVTEADRPDTCADSAVASQ
jgi:hypothetical protein